MARRKHRSKARTPRAVSTRRYRSSPVRLLSSPVPLSTLRLLPTGDSRFFHPLPSLTRPFAAAPRAAARLVVAPMAKMRFASPLRVAVCVRRKVRKQVLFAARIAGGRVGRPHRTITSDIKC